MVLVYPVIRMSGELMHLRSRTLLLGENPSAELITAFSNDGRVTPETPPTFLLHTQDDDVVDVRNSLVFYEALINNKVSSALHVFTHGEHGLGIEPPFVDWLPLCMEWMQDLFK
jgi:acetyl esterase/lipase